MQTARYLNGLYPIDREPAPQFKQTSLEDVVAEREAAAERVKQKREARRLAALNQPAHPE